MYGNNQQPVGPSPPPYASYPVEDEISLADLWRVLVEHKNTYFGVTAVITLGALLYALLATPVYRAATIFLPPTAGDVERLKIAEEGIDVNTMFTLFEQNLSSIRLRETIFKEMNLLDEFASEREPDASTEVIFSRFNETLTISTTTAARKDETVIPTITFAMEWVDPVLIAQIINRLAKEAERATALEVISGIQASVAVQVEDLNLEVQLLRAQVRTQRQDEIVRLAAADGLERETINDNINSLRDRVRKERLAEISRLEETDQIERNSIDENIRTLRKSAKEKRLDRVAILKEASGIAHALEIKDSIGYKLKKISDSAATKSQILTSISNDAPELYTRGYEALDAEIASLSSRAVDDPFIKNLRGLQDRLQQLKYNEKIAALKDRGSDDPFIPELRGLQEKLKLLENNRRVEQLKNRENDDPFIKVLRDKENELARLASINIDPATVKTARIDQAAYAPEKRIKPKRKLIVVLGLMSGLILGVFVVFFVNFIKNQKQQPAI